MTDITLDQTTERAAEYRRAALRLIAAASGRPEIYAVELGRFVTDLLGDLPLAPDDRRAAAVVFTAALDGAIVIAWATTVVLAAERDEPIEAVLLVIENAVEKLVESSQA